MAAARTKSGGAPAGLATAGGGGGGGSGGRRRLPRVRVYGWAGAAGWAGGGAIWRAGAGSRRYLYSAPERSPARVRPGVGARFFNITLGRKIKRNTKRTPKIPK